MVKRYSVSQGICIDPNPDRLVMENDYLRLVRAARGVLKHFYDPEQPDQKQFSELIVLRDLIRSEPL
jgi:hypothetical protein